MKTCTKCGHSQPLDQFYPLSDPTRARSPCRTCRKKEQEDQKEEKRAYDRARYKAQRGTIIARVRVYNEDRKAEKKAYDQAQSSLRNAKRRNRYRTDETYRLGVLIRNRVRSAITGYRKGAGTEALLGCTLTNFRGHFEKKFLPGMSWTDVLEGRVHIDHVIPCAAFNMSDPEQQKLCFHFRNLQPLWASENNAKRARTAEEHIRPGSPLALRRDRQFAA